MKLIEKYTLKLKQILPKRFTSNSLKIETLEEKLKEKLKLNIEFPLCCQMFFLLCTSWEGMFEEDFLFKVLDYFPKKNFYQKHAIGSKENLKKNPKFQFNMLIWQLLKFLNLDQDTFCV
jgi:hypothetical protein